MAGSLPNGPSRKRSLGSTCRWKALRAEEAAALDGAAVESVLGASTKAGAAGWKRGATGSVRGRSPASHAVENAAARQRCPKGNARSAPPRGIGGQWSERPKLEARRQSRPTWGRIAARLSGAAQIDGLTSGGLRGRLRESGALGNRAVHGCSCRESDAEVGEKHLPRVDRGEPRGKPRGHEVARRGGIAPRQGEVTPRRAKGCEAQARERTSDRAGVSLGREVEDRIRRKASWINEAHASKPRGGSSGPGRGGKRVTRREPGGRRRARGRSPRASTAAATEDVRDRDVGSGSFSRRAQGVGSQRGRHVRAIALRPVKS